MWPLEQLKAVCDAGRERGVKRHLDGARLWHATAATGIAESEYARHFDSVSVCFSKGLGAPVGSALAGSREFITRARRFKQQIGGGFRQAGIIAAGALYALQNNRARLIEDHENARLLAEGIASLPGIEIDVKTVETNIVRFAVTSLPAGEFVERLYEKGLYVLPSGTDGVRAIPYLNISKSQVQEAIGIIASVAEAYADKAGALAGQTATRGAGIKGAATALGHRCLLFTSYVGAPACRLGSAFMNAGCSSHAAMMRSIVGTSGMTILNTRVTATMLARQISAMVGSSP